MAVDNGISTDKIIGKNEQAVEKIILKNIMQCPHIRRSRFSSFGYKINGKIESGMYIKCAPDSKPRYIEKKGNIIMDWDKIIKKDACWNIFFAFKQRIMQ